MNYKEGIEKVIMLRKISDINEYDIHECRETAAKVRGLVTKFPAANELQLDIDTDEGYEIYKNVLSIFPKGHILEVEEHESTSGLPHRHITITLSDEYSELEKIAMQFMFGSDRVRESLGVLRSLAGLVQPSCFFEEKPKLTPTFKRKIQRKR